MMMPLHILKSMQDLILRTLRAGVTPEPLGMPMPGSLLPQRIQRMLSHASAPTISPIRAIYVAAAIASLALLFGTGKIIQAQPVTKAPSVSSTFEVASVKPNSSGEPRVSGGFLAGGVYKVSNYTLRALIAAAYVRPQVNPDFLISGGPDWIDADHFDVEAKAAASFPPGPDTVTSSGRVMLQALLIDRFHLKAHLESNERPIYALRLARNGKPSAGLAPSTLDCPVIPSPAPSPTNGKLACGPRIGPGSIEWGGATIAQLINLLPRFVDRVVRDQTGLTGKFDVSLKWSPAPGEWIAPPPAGGSAMIPTDGPSIFTAIFEQWGLKLESVKGPVEILIIDSADRPSEN